MIKRKNSKKKRLQSAFMAGLMAFSTFAGSFSTPLVVQAAAPTTTPNTGDILISWVDSSVYGADRNALDITLNMKLGVNQMNVGGYWDSSLSNYDFLYTPEGIASAETRRVLIYDLGPSGSAPTGDVRPGTTTTYYTKNQLDTLVTNGNATMYTRTLKNGNYGVITHTISANAGWDGHRLVIIEDNIAIPGYYPSVEANMANNEAWQAVIDYSESNTYDIQYNNNTVGSKYTNAIPLHNEVWRGGFQFTIDDKDLGTAGKSQGMGKLTDAKFVVYNINNGGENWTNDGTSPDGYVIADRNNDGTISKYQGDGEYNVEQLQYIPAYSANAIINLYEEYLASPTYDDYVNADGEFIMGKINNRNLVPVMTLTPDANGVVKTSDIALPTGNYLVLQVKAGKGYFIDEDFRPIVSIGKWDAANSNITGFGTVYPTVIPEAADVDMGNHLKPSYAEGLNDVNGTSVAYNGVAFCPIGTVTDISVLNPSFTFNGGYTAGGTGSKLTYESVDGESVFGLEGAGNNYVQNEGILKDNIKRLAPVVGQSRFAAHNTIVRSGVKLYLADSDDIKVENRVQDINVDENGNYIIVPQGDGVLDGSKFQLIVPTTDLGANIDMKSVKINGVTYNKGDGPVYTVVNGKISIPVDEVPYGAYEFKQIALGEGYVENPKTIGLIVVSKEDNAVCTPKDGVDVSDITVIDGATYVTNILVNGGESYTINSNSNEDVDVTISVYNISDNYVYVSPDGTQAETRFETIKDLYESQIKGKSLTAEEVANILKDETPCKTYDVNLNDAKTTTQSLPYGTYLMVLSGIPTGYVLDGDPYMIDDIKSPTDSITFEADVNKEDVVPTRPVGIKTELLDANYGMDSIRSDKDVVLFDYVDVEGLTGGVTYTAYGVLVDMETGEIFAPGNIPYTRFTTYKATPTMVEEKYTEEETYVDPETKEVKTRIVEKTRMVEKWDPAELELDGTASFVMHFDYIDTSKIENKTLVAFEYICADNVLVGDPVNGQAKPDTDVAKATTIAELNAALNAIGVIGMHRSLLDEDQTVYIAGLDIDAVASYSKDKYIDPSESVQGTVYYSNVEIGNTYRIDMKLYDEHDNPITDKGGAPLVISKTFTAVNTYGEVTDSFTDLDPEVYNNHRLTVYADLYRVGGTDVNKDGACKLISKGDSDTMGWDISDELPGDNQVEIINPEVSTVLTDKFGSKEVDFRYVVSLTDTVEYKNLIIGGNYRSVFTLVDENGEALTDDAGNAIVSTVDFTATESEAIVKLPVTFLATKLIGSKVVAFNDLYRVTPDNTKIVVSEHDVTLEDQTVVSVQDIEITKPVIETVFTDSDTNSDSIACDKNVALKDNIKISNLLIDKQYSIYSVIVDAETGDFYKNGLIEFTNVTAGPDPSVTSVDADNASKLAIMIAQGEAMTYSDSDKMVWLNSVETYNTTLNNLELANYIASAKDASKEETFNDFKIKIVGTLKSELNKLGITNVSLGGYVETDVYFDVLDMSDVEGKTLVAYTYLCSYSGEALEAAMAATSIAELSEALQGKVIAYHENIKDEEQTVRTSALDIDAVASVSNTKDVDPSESIKAIVTYGNLEIGADYEIVATLYDKDSNKIENQVKTTAFTARRVDGTVEFVFDELKAADYKGQRLTVYADLYRVEKDNKIKLISKGDADSMDWDITSEIPGDNQVDVLIPTIETVLADENNNKEIDANNDVKLVDTVTYTDLIVGAKYRSVLTLVNKEGTEVFADNGKAITATVEFEATTSTMEIKIPVEFKATKLIGMELVAFNDLYRITKQSVVKVAEEHDVESEAQTVKMIEIVEATEVVISTVVNDPISKSHTIPAISGTSAVDTVVITGLAPNTNYVYVTEIAYASTGKVIPQLKEVEHAITSDENGECKLTIDISFDATLFIGENLVVYGTLYNEGRKEIVAEHKDKDNANQTMIIPAMNTIATLSDGKTKDVPIAEDVTIQDLIIYTGLNAGQKYVLTTELVNKEGGAVISTLTTEFTPDTANGKMVVSMNVNTVELKGAQLVVTQTVKDYYTGDVILTHNDLEDADQTVTVGKLLATYPDGTINTGEGPGGPGAGKDIQTGVAENAKLFFILAIVSALIAAAGAGYIIYDKKKKLVNADK